MPKSIKELQEQFRTVNDSISAGGKESSLIPPSVQEKNVLKMSEEDIKNTWPYRYEMYVKLVRELPKFHQEGGVSEETMLPKEEIEDMKKWLQALNSLDLYIKNHIEGNVVTLKDRQFTVFEDIRKFLEHGGSEGYVKLPTGVGKTVLFTELVEAMNLRTLIVVPTRLLIRQTEEKIEKFAPDLDVGKVYAKAKQYGRQVTVTTYYSLVSQIESGVLNPADFDSVILDEVHVALSKKRKDAIDQFEHAIKLGFTATPEYSDKKKVGDLLETQIHGMSIREAIEDEALLSSFSSIIARTDVDLTKVELNKSGEYDEDQLEKAVNIQSRNQAAVDLYKRMFDGKLAIAYCVGVSHAENVAKLFNEAGVPAAVISGETPEDEQEDLKKKFHNGEIKVLCNADILIAGFDEPRASVCLNLRPTHSRVVAEQRGGRVLRLDEDNEEKYAVIVDFIDRGLEENMPVLFADIVGAAQILQKKEGKGGGGKNPPVPGYTTIEIPGLEVLVDIEEIMSIVNEKHAKETMKEKISLDQLRAEVRAEFPEATGNLRILYRAACEKHPNWPKDPTVFFKDAGWVRYTDLFGKEVVKKVVSLDQLKTEVRAAGVNSFDKYRTERINHPQWVMHPDITFKDNGWVSWPDLFGKKKISLEELKKEVQAAGVDSFDKYHAARQDHPHWPSVPKKFFKSHGWKNWSDIFGREEVEKISSLDQLKNEVRTAGVNSFRMYHAARQYHPHWPARPDVFFADNWSSWSDLFGKKT